MLVKSSRIYTDEGLRSGFLSAEDGVFAGVLDTAKGEYEDYGNQRIIPGIFDTHNHGTNGYSLLGDMEGYDNLELIHAYLKSCASQGITSVFPTVTTKSEYLIKDIAKAARGPLMGSEIVGIHSEGPWLNRVGEKGVWVSWPEVDIERAKTMVNDGDGLLKLVALAPEIEGIEPIIEYFQSQGIVLALAHSDMNYKQAAEAYNKRGLSVSTHLGNVMTGIHHRDIGILGASLLDDNVYNEIICDGIHLCYEILKLFFKTKDHSRFMMISDSTAFVGAPVGTYEDMFFGFTITVTENGHVLSETGRLLGPNKPLLHAIGNLVEHVELPLETVLKMAALNPCCKYGLDKVKGSITKGKQADFVVISDDYKAVATYVKGEKVFDDKVDKNLYNHNYGKGKFTPA